MSNHNQHQNQQGNGNKPPMPVAQQQPAQAPNPAPAEAADDQMIISGVTLRTLITIGSHGVDAISIRGAMNGLHHGNIRFELCDEGVRIVYANKQSNVYEEHTVYAANIADVCRVPLASLKPETRAAWEKCQKEVRR